MAMVRYQYTAWQLGGSEIHQLQLGVTDWHWLLRASEKICTCGGEIHGCAVLYHFNTANHIIMYRSKFWRCSEITGGFWSSKGDAESGSALRHIAGKTNELLNTVILGRNAATSMHGICIMQLGCAVVDAVV